MEQLKHYLRIAGKYHFWIICGVIALLTLGSWYTTSASLTKQYNDNKQKITAAETSLNTISKKENHPNLHFHQQMDLILNSYKDQLRDLWEKQYIDQGANLRWPAQTDTEPGLTQEFVEQVVDLRPIETTVPYDPANKGLDKLKDNFKAEYINYVKSIALPNLAKTIQAVWRPSMDTGGTSGPVTLGERGGMDTLLDPNAPKEMVLWNAENQAFLQNTRFDWTKEVGGRPSTLQILYAQEDLWVLDTLMKIIAKTNADSDAPHNAVVKQIMYVKLGADAVGLSGAVTRLTAANAVGPDGRPLAGAPGAVPTTSAMPDPRLSGNPLLPGGALPTKDPAEGRYVDDKYLPIPPTRLRAAFTSNDANEAFLAVAKRMPVRMHLVVDQRKLHKLLAEFGNSNLIVEIRQMRVNRELYAGGPSVGVAPGGEAGRPLSGGGGGLGGGAPINYGGRSGEPGSTDEEKPQFDIGIELYGIVYIYNPVNEAMVTAVATDGAPATTEAVPEPASPVAPAPVAPLPAAPVPAVPMDEAAPAVPMGQAPPEAPMPVPAEPAGATPAPMPMTTPAPAAPGA